MANTTNFNWETPDDTDLVKDGAAAIRTLGSAIDTSLVDLKGGTTGQVLSKATNTDMDFTWVAQDDSNAIQNAIVDAKGDLISATAADTPARLAVGTNGQVLTADSSTSTGLKWASASSTPTFVGCRLYKTSNQAISTSTWTAITYDAESFDTDAFHDNSTNNTRITIPSGKGGYYLINARLNLAANSTGARLARFTINGNELFAGISVPGSNQADAQYTLSTIQNLSAADYIEFLVLHNVGSNLDFTGAAGADKNEFSVQYLGA
jgi:hypothetical protein